MATYRKGAPLSAAFVRSVTEAGVFGDGYGSRGLRSGSRFPGMGGSRSSGFSGFASMAGLRISGSGASRPPACGKPE